jgi:hypothetical protein
MGRDGRKHSVNPPAIGGAYPYQAAFRASRGAEIQVGRSTALQGLYDVSDAGISFSLPHARLCSVLRFQGINRSTSSAARPPALAHASR